MSKGARIKFLRKLARSLPQISRNVVIGTEIVKGADLPEDAKIRGGRQVNPNHKYRTYKTGERPINHNRRLKKLYNRYGMPGVTGYVNGVTAYVNAQKQEK